MKTLPSLGPNHTIKLPRIAERTLSNGLTVIAVRRPSVPLVELRLRVPFAKANIARGALLTQSLFAGTSEMTSLEIAAELQKIGGGLSSGCDPDRLLVVGNSLVSGLDRLLDLLAQVLGDAAYPKEEVATERARLADRLQVAESQPAHLARVALLKRVYGKHPYAVQTPTAQQIRAVSPVALRTLHAERVHPAGATLVLVGDLSVDKALDAAERALSTWDGGGKDATLPPVPDLVGGPLTLVDRPGSVQSSIRVALPAVPRTHPDHAALQLANLVLGGYFSSRWVENIREDKGYSYGPSSSVEHSAAGSVVVLSAEVGTEVTGLALLETQYELGRMASAPPSQEELDQARQYATGTLHLGMSTQAGLAGLLSMYAGFGLRLDYLAEHSAKLTRTTREEVAAAAAKYLAPSGAAAVVLGDAEQVRDRLAVLTEVVQG